MFQGVTLFRKQFIVAAYNDALLFIREKVVYKHETDFYASSLYSHEILGDQIIAIDSSGCLRVISVLFNKVTDNDY